MQLFCFFGVVALMQTVNYYVNKTMYLQFTWFFRSVLTRTMLRFSSYMCTYLVFHVQFEEQ